jgi:hypothetical protein
VEFLFLLIVFFIDQWDYIGDGIEKGGVFGDFVFVIEGYFCFVGV